MKKIILYFFAFILVQLVVEVPLVMLYKTVTGNNPATSAEIIITGCTLSGLLTIILFVWRKWHPLSFSYLRTHPWHVLYWCVLLALGVLIPSQYLEEFIPELLRTDLAADTFKTLMNTPWGYLAIGIFAPLVEETVFRGAIQREALKFFCGKGMSHWVAIAFTALLFAAAHGNPAQMPHAFLVGLLLGWLCYRSGSIVPGIVVHWVNNSVAFLGYALYPPLYDMETIDLFGGSYLRLAGAIALSLALAIPAIYQLNRIMKR